MNNSSFHMKRLIIILIFLVTLIITLYIISPRSSTRELRGIIQPYYDYENTDVLNDFTITEGACDEPEEIPDLLEPTEDTPLAITRYAKFHREGKRCLLEYIKTGNLTCEEIPKVLVWKGEMSLIGGFGDRMTSMRNMFMLALISRRIFLIKWPWQSSTPYKLASGLFPAYIDWRFPIEEIENDYAIRSDNNSISVQFRFGGFDDNGDFVYGFENPFPSPVAEPILYPNTTDFEKAFSKYPVIYNFFTLLHREFINQCTKNIVAKDDLIGLTNLPFITLQRLISNVLFRPSSIVNYLARRQSFSRDKSFVAAHIRVGTDVMESFDGRFTHLQENKALKKLSRLVLKCIERSVTSTIVEGMRTRSMTGRRNNNDLYEIQKDGSKKLRVFLASDTLNLKDIFVKQAKKFNMIVHTTRRHGWHIDKGRSGLFGDNNTEHCLAFLDVFADAYALSDSKAVFYLESNFPRVSIGMGNVKFWHQIDSKKKLVEDECVLSNLTTSETYESIF